LQPGQQPPFGHAEISFELFDTLEKEENCFLTSFEPHSGHKVSSLFSKVSFSNLLLHLLHKYSKIGILHSLLIMAV